MATSSAFPASAEVAGPVTTRERIASIDVMRGVALLGILAMNIQDFSMIGSAYLNPTTYGDLHGLNYAVWYGSFLLADLKFMSIFSMLFGELVPKNAASCRSEMSSFFVRIGQTGD